MDTPANNIPEEEKQQLDSIIESITKQYSLANEISQEYEKLLECRHEIVVTVVAKVLEQNDTGDIVGMKEICKQNYHIPVPQNKNYHDYMHGFFNHLQNCMAVSDSKSTESSPDITNE